MPLIQNYKLFKFFILPNLIMYNTRKNKQTKCRSLQITGSVVHLNFRAGSIFSLPVCTVPSSMDRTSRGNKVDAVRLYASHKLNLLLLKGHRCVRCMNWQTNKSLPRNRFFKIFFHRYVIF